MLLCHITFMWVQAEVLKYVDMTTYVKSISIIKLTMV